MIYCSWSASLRFLHKNSLMPLPLKSSQRWSDFYSVSDDDLMRAFYKAMQAAGMRMQNYGTVFASINDESKADGAEIGRASCRERV